MAETVELELALPLVVMVTGANAGGWDAVAMTLVIVPYTGEICFFVIKFMIIVNSNEILHDYSGKGVFIKLTEL